MSGEQANRNKVALLGDNGFDSLRRNQMEKEIRKFCKKDGSYSFPEKVTSQESCTFQDFIDLEMITPPSAPPSGTVRVYVREKSGDATKIQLVGKFPDGTESIILEGSKT